MVVRCGSMTVLNNTLHTFFIGLSSKLPDYVFGLSIFLFSNNLGKIAEA
jgi:hypothetical protein